MDLIESLRAVKWEVTDDGDRMPDDPTHKCVFVDMRPDDFRALLREAAAALAQDRASQAAAPSAPVGVEVSGYIATVPDNCDRIIWRGHYYHLPLAQQPAAPSGEAVARDPYAPTDREVIQDFLNICREMKPVGRWPGEVVCGAIERMLNEPKGFRFIAKADMAPERGHNGRGGDADRPFSGPRRGTPQQPAAVNEAMVERALAAYLRRQEDGESLYGCVTAALTAALAGQQQGGAS